MKQKDSLRQAGALSSPALGDRLTALKEYVRGNAKVFSNRWINLHVHTNESFSYFSSPTESVMRAYDENVYYFGINDHYTIDGHGEFRAACAIAGLEPFYSIEAIALDVVTLAMKRRFNDPNNPGRIYIIGKGVTKDLGKGSREEGIFDGMKEAIRKRNMRIVERMNAHAEGKGVPLDLRYDDVRALTPKGNSTERHVVQAFCEKVGSLSKSGDERIGLFEKLLGVKLDNKTVEDQAELQTLVRAKLVKSGMPCYVEEDEKAFTSIQNLVQIFRQYGTIPTYGVMGNPITEEEDDLEALFKKVTGMGMYGLDLFEFRTKLERAREIVEAARAYGLPVFIGTEHNTKTEAPLTGEIGRDPGLYPYLKESADFLKGHQLLSELCDFGYLDAGGSARFGDLNEGFRFFAGVGAMELPAERLEKLKTTGMRERRTFFGI